MSWEGIPERLHEAPAAVVFDWRLSRRHGELTTLLSDDYAGLLQSDGYEAYGAYARSHPAVVWLGCWAHARRRFCEAQQEHPRVARAALRLIRPDVSAGASLGRAALDAGPTGQSAG